MTSECLIISTQKKKLDGDKTVLHKSIVVLIFHYIFLGIPYGPTVMEYQPFWESVYYDAVINVCGWNKTISSIF